MLKQTKHIIIVFFLSIGNIGFSQVDTSAIVSEINSLTNDSLIDDYWLRLYASDQDMKTFENPVQQIENLIKCCYFFKKFGFSNNNRYATNKVSYTDAEMHTLYIWMHCSFTDLNYLTFPLIVESLKIYKHADSDYPDYFLQNLVIYSTDRGPEIKAKTLLSAESNSFNQIEMKKIIDLANEFELVYKEIANGSRVSNEWLDTNFVIGSWKIGKFKVNIIKTHKDIYYLESLGNLFKLEKKSDSLYQFSTNIDGTYLQIMENGDLVNLNEKTLQIYTK